MAPKIGFPEEEQRSFIKFRTLFQESSKNIYEDLVKVCAGDVLTYATVKLWAQRFRECRENIEDDFRSGRPQTAIIDYSIDNVRQFLFNDPCCSIEEICR